MFFNRVVFSTFLFLALICFGVSSAFAATYTYFSQGASTGTVCDTAPDFACNKTYAQISAAQPWNHTKGSCVVNGWFITLEYQKFQTNSVTGEKANIEDKQLDVGDVNKITCADDEELKLVGCTATCVPKEDDPCEPKRGQRQSLSVACGTLSCGGGGKTVRTGSTFGCSTGVGTFSASQPTSTGVKDSCTLIALAQSSATPKLSDGLAKTADIGRSSLTMYCSQEYEYTGVTGGQDTPAPNANLSFYGAVPMPPSGLCPNDKPQPTHINDVDACIDNQLPDSSCPIPTEKPNANGLCVPPTDPTYPKDNDPNKDPNEDTPNTCPKGQIKNLSGTCVPYGDATECPTGQTRNNMGLCAATPEANACPQGQTKNAQGTCANDPRGTGCADGSLPNNLGVCANGQASCGIGQTRNAQGVCASASSGSGCKDGSTANSSGMCADGSASCGAGKVRNAQGVCVSDSTDSSKNTSASLATNCTTAPACDGDPILCAMYNQQWKNNCESIRAPNDNEKAQVMGAISDTNSQIEANENEYKAAIESIIGGSGLLNNPVPTTAQCIPDKQVVIMNGLSVTVPFMLLCPYFTLLRSMLIMVAYMFAARIVYAELTGGGIRV